jgi:hypothetical protein
MKPKKKITIEVVSTRQFEARKNADTRKKRARNGIEVILGVKELELSLKKAVLSKLLYAWTEAEPKNRHVTKFQSVGAMSAIHARGTLVHEHVKTRKSVVEELINNPKGIDKILRSTVECTITSGEDAVLRKSDLENKKDKRHNGWIRYKRAGIEVYDVVSGSKKS